MPASDLVNYDDMLAWALLYAKHGGRILPLHKTGERAKTPVGRLACHGWNSASSDPAVLRRWWATGNWNIGLIVPDGFKVYDIDPRNGGLETHVKTEREHGPFPVTPAVDTGGGGTHLWISCGTGVYPISGPGIDIIVSGRYVVAPPSLHASGRRYLWRNVNVPVALLPARLSGPPPKKASAATISRRPGCGTSRYPRDPLRPWDWRRVNKPRSQWPAKVDGSLVFWKALLCLYMHGYSLGEVEKIAGDPSNWSLRNQVEKKGIGYLRAQYDWMPYWIDKKDAAERESRGGNY